MEKYSEKNGFFLKIFDKTNATAWSMLCLHLNQKNPINKPSFHLNASDYSISAISSWSQHVLSRTLVCSTFLGLLYSRFEYFFFCWSKAFCFVGAPAGEDNELVMEGSAAVPSDVTGISSSPSWGPISAPGVSGGQPYNSRPSYGFGGAPSWNMGNQGIGSTAWGSPSGMTRPWGDVSMVRRPWMPQVIWKDSNICINFNAEKLRQSYGSYEKHRNNARLLWG